MSVRCKLRLTSIKQSEFNPTARTLAFEARYDTSIPEDQRFYDATPWGTFEMLVNNPKALEQLELGKDYYLDLTPASAE